MAQSRPSPRLLMQFSVLSVIAMQKALHDANYLQMRDAESRPLQVMAEIQFPIVGNDPAKSERRSRALQREVEGFITQLAKHYTGSLTLTGLNQLGENDLRRLCNAGPDYLSLEAMAAIQQIESESGRARRPGLFQRLKPLPENVDDVLNYLSALTTDPFRADDPCLTEFVAQVELDNFPLGRIRMDTLSDGASTQMAL